MVRRDPHWEEIKNWGGHPRFINRGLLAPDNTVTIHYSPTKVMRRDLVGPKLERLGWTEEYLKREKFVR